MNFPEKQILCLSIVTAVILSGCQTLVPTDVPTSTDVIGVTSNPPPTAAPSPSPTEILFQGTITIWHSWDESRLAALVQIITNFQTIYPDVQFDVLYLPPEILRLRFEEEVFQGDGPAVLLAPAAWGPSLYNAGAIAPLENMIDPAVIAGIPAPALGSGQYRGTLIGLPYTQQGVVLYRNRQIILEPPPTLEALTSLAKQATRGETIGAYLERSFFYSGAHLVGLGGEWMDTDGNPAFNNEKGIAWLELLKRFDDAGPTELLTDRDLERFKAGKVGFLIDGTWNIKTLTETVGIENLAIDPWPLHPQGALSGFVQASNIYLNVNQIETTLPAVQKFAEYFLSQAAQQQLVTAGMLPVVDGIAFPNLPMEQAYAALKGGVSYPIQPEVELYLAPMEFAIKSALIDSVSYPQALQAAEDALLASLEARRLSTTPFP